VCTCAEDHELLLKLLTELESRIAAQALLHVPLIHTIGATENVMFELQIEVSQLFVSASLCESVDDPLLAVVVCAFSL
jgi:hypothetical protein